MASRIQGHLQELQRLYNTLPCNLLYQHNNKTIRTYTREKQTSFTQPIEIKFEKKKKATNRELEYQDQEAHHEEECNLCAFRSLKPSFSHLTAS